MESRFIEPRALEVHVVKNNSILGYFDLLKLPFLRNKSYSLEFALAEIFTFNFGTPDFRTKLSFHTRFEILVFHSIYDII